MKVLSYIIRIFLLPIGPFRKLNKSIQLYSCKRWYIKFAAPRVPEEIQTPVCFKSRRFYIPASKCCLAEVSSSKSSLGSCEQRSTSSKETYLSQSTPRGASTVFLVNNNLLPPHICVVDLFKTQENGIWTRILSQSPAVQETAAAAVSSHSLGFWIPNPCQSSDTPAFTVPSPDSSNSWHTGLLLIERLATVSRQAHVNKY